MTCHCYSQLVPVHTHTHSAITNPCGFTPRHPFSAQHSTHPCTQVHPTTTPALTQYASIATNLNPTPSPPPSRRTRGLRRGWRATWPRPQPPPARTRRCASRSGTTRWWRPAWRARRDSGWWRLQGLAWVGWGAGATQGQLRRMKSRCRWPQPRCQRCREAGKSFRQEEGVGRVGVRHPQSMRQCTTDLAGQGAVGVQGRVTVGTGMMGPGPAG